MGPIGPMGPKGPMGPMGPMWPMGPMGPGPKGAQKGCIAVGGGFPCFFVVVFVCFVSLFVFVFFVGSVQRHEHLLQRHESLRAHCHVLVVRGDTHWVEVAEGPDDTSRRSSSRWWPVLA